MQQLTYGNKTLDFEISSSQKNIIYAKVLNLSR